MHEKLGPTCPEVRVYKIRIILLYLCRSNKKVYGFWFLEGGINLYYLIHSLDISRFMPFARVLVRK